MPNTTFIVAEMGGNHDGDLSRAIELIHIAKDAGADAVKFQLIPPFKADWIDKLITVCGLANIEFMATPFNEAGIMALRGKVKHWKIAATEAADDTFVSSVLRAAGKDPVFISDGAVDNPMKFLREGANVIPMACVVKYPADEEDYALGYQGRWGLSDHTTHLLLPMIAVARGAVAVEKHFTDDPKREGPDHSFALDPEKLTEMVKLIRMTEKILTNQKQTITEYVGRKLQWP